MQELPWDIVYQIVCGLISRNESIIKKFSSYNGLNDVLVLLKVNHTWRSAALAFMLQSFSIVFPQHNCFASTKFKYWPRYMGKAEEYGYGYIKEIEVNARLAAIASGSALKTMKTMNVFNTEFTSVNSLTLTISGSLEDYWGNASDYQQHTEAFFKFIGKYSSLNIVCEHISFGNASGINDVLFSNINQAAGQAKYAGLSIYGLRAPPGIQPALNLSALDIEWNADYKTTACFIHRCSPQLTKLCIEYKSFDGMDSLVLGNIRCPSLRKLALTTELYNSPIMEYYSEGIPFPYLKHLKLSINYPFADDTLFRSSSLESLQLVNHRGTLENISGFFSNSKLQHLGFVSHPHNMKSRYTYEELVSERYPHEFVRIFKQTLKTLEAKLYYDSKLDIQKFLFPENLQMLNIPEAYLTMREIITLLDYLQSLSHLTCNLNPGVRINITSSEVEELVSNYYPLNTVFWNWRLARRFLHDYATVAIHLIVFAMLCPNFSYMDTSSHNPRLYGMEISRQISLLKLDKYKDQIVKQLWRHVNGDLFKSGEFESDNGSDDESMSGCELVEDFSLLA
ncbi:hypothetical protein BX667DRAFT_508977 [Coemansia mojavensis]|nr:hypothetical protein BX667DRAFT_508977 [Coemansia mojavensis]